jgi:hypothetical protein
MSTIELERTQWETSLGELSARYRGARATIERIGPEIGAQVDAVEAAFHGVVADLAHHRLMVVTGASDADRREYPIDDPVVVRVQVDEGDGDTLEIESADRQQLLIRLRRSPELPVGKDR